MKYTTTALILLSALSCVHGQTPFDRDFSLLRDQRDKAIAAATEPINHRYQASLEQLLRRATQGSDLDTALKVKAELQALTSAITPTTSAVRATPSTTGGVTVTPNAPIAPKVRSSNLVLSSEPMTWDEAIQWCAANRVQMMSYATWADEKNRKKLNDDRGKSGVWVGLTYDFDKKVWLDVDGSVVAKPLFNSSMKPPGQSGKAVGVHAAFWGGNMIYTLVGDEKQRVLGTKIP